MKASTVNTEGLALTVMPQSTMHKGMIYRKENQKCSQFHSQGDPVGRIGDGKGQRQSDMISAVDQLK